MAEVGAFASRPSVSRELQAQVDELAASLPAGCVAIKPEVQPAPSEWLLESDGQRCACGRCGKDAGPPDATMEECQQQEDAAWFVEARVASPDPADRCYRGELRVRFVVGAWFARLAPITWPCVRFLDDIMHLGVEADGSVQSGIFTGFYDQLFDVQPGIGPPGMLRSSLAVLLELLHDLPPSSVYGSEGNAELRRNWSLFAQQNRARLDVIDKYAGRALHPDLFQPAHAETDWSDVLDPALLTALCARNGLGQDPAPLRALLYEEMPNVWSFPLFLPSFCNRLLSEVENYNQSGLPIRRPNSMNNYGLVLNLIGLEGFMTRLQQDVAQPIAHEMFPDEGEWLDDHHSFTVRYAANEDLGLDMHTDDSDVTFNVCLGKQFAGAGLTFCGVIGEGDHRQFKHCYEHRVGRCIMHLGRQRHGADDITSGVRVNLIMWNRSTAFRRRRSSQPYEREIAPPSPQCLSFTHDRDFGRYKPVPSSSSPRVQPWCPPPGKEHVNEDAAAEADPLPPLAPSPHDT